MVDHWYCLTVVPQKEFLTRTILGHTGYKTCVPREFKYTRRHGVAHIKVYPLLGPRYVFVRASYLDVCRMRRDVHLITGLVEGHDGPAKFEHSVVSALDSICISESLESDGAIGHKAYKLGSLVTLNSGAWQGHEGRIVEVDRGRVQVLLRILGGVRAVWAPFDAIG